MTNKTTESTNTDVNFAFLSESSQHMFFTKEEMDFFLKKDFKNIILYKNNGVPYLNYDVSKKIFETVLGNNYSLEIMSYEYVPEFETLMVHVRFTLIRGDKKIIKDVIGCEKAIKSKSTNEIQNFQDLSKSAVKDAYKKFLNDYIGIGSYQFSKAKEEYAKGNKGFNNSYNNSYNSNNNNSNNNNSNNNASSSNQSYACSDCKAPITQKIYSYSVNYHSEKRPLCPNCQKKY